MTLTRRRTTPDQLDVELDDALDRIDVLLNEIDAAATSLTNTTTEDPDADRP